LAKAATRDILLLGPVMLTGLRAMGSDNFRLKAIFGPGTALAFAKSIRAFVAKT
jgi:hypothetical protein